LLFAGCCAVIAFDAFHAFHYWRTFHYAIDTLLASFQSFSLLADFHFDISLTDITPFHFLSVSIIFAITPLFSAFTAFGAMEEARY
jgi:hypothetical protein